MRNLKRDTLRTVMFATVVATIFAPTLVQAKDYKVGVKAGDWIKYGQITVTYTGQELNLSQPGYVADMKKVDWIRVDVLSVAGTTASLNETVHYNNGTQTFLNRDPNVQDTDGEQFLVASNLTAGDVVSSQNPQTNISQTGTRMYAGANRNVNIIDYIGSYPSLPSEDKIYFDKETGIMVEVYMNYSTHFDNENASGYVETSIKATETNLWSANVFDLVQDNLLYIIAGAAIIIFILAAVMVLRRRKTTFSHQPPPSPTPPPTPPRNGKP